MKTAGIKELKEKLSGYINEVRRGETVLVKDHSEEVAIIKPVSRDYMVIRQLMKANKAQWDYGKPQGLSKRIIIEGKSLSATILEERE